MAAAAAAGSQSDQNNVSAVNSAITFVAKGYVIKTTSYLFKLKWNDEMAATFYQDYWTDDANLDEEKKAAFENSDIFGLKFVGQQSAWADIQSTMASGKSGASSTSACWMEVKFVQKSLKTGFIKGFTNC